MDQQRYESGHLMLLTPERVFYAGLLGRPRRRRPGAFHIYVAIQGELLLTLDDGAESRSAIVMVPPNVPHTIACDHRSVICLVIEPESVRADAFNDLAGRLSGPDCKSAADRILAAYDVLRLRNRADALTTAEFDRQCFGDALPQRALDPRIVMAMKQIGCFSGDAVTAASCATAAGLSASRFLHLFKQETGICFRSFRAWKRARHFLNYANQEINLAHLAQEIGYPDSTHFSHSIRRFYGLKPRAIFSGSRDLEIIRSEPMPA